MRMIVTIVDSPTAFMVETNYFVCFVIVRWLATFCGMRTTVEQLCARNAADRIELEALNSSGPRRDAFTARRRSSVPILARLLHLLDDLAHLMVDLLPFGNPASSRTAPHRLNFQKRSSIQPDRELHSSYIRARWNNQTRKWATDDMQLATHSDDRRVARPTSVHLRRKRHNICVDGTSLLNRMAATHGAPTRQRLLQICGRLDRK